MSVLVNDVLVDLDATTASQQTSTSAINTGALKFYFSFCLEPYCYLQ
jgi:hypothetical protein